MDEENILEIRYPEGQMRIVLENMFPCTKKDLRIILKALDRGAFYQDRERTALLLIRWIEEKVWSLQDADALRELSALIDDARQKSQDCEDQLALQKKLVDALSARVKTITDKPARKKAAEKLKAEKEKYEALSVGLRLRAADLRNYQAEYDGRLKKSKKLMENLAFLEEYCWR